MELTDEQKQRVAAWLNEGLKLSEIQTRIETEFDLRPTYMDVKFLVSDLEVIPKDPEEAPAADAEKQEAGQPTTSPLSPDGTLQPGGGQVSVSVDQITQAGALVSGKVTFGDGKEAKWYLDQTGRLALAPQEQGYRPSEADMQSFRAALEQEIAKSGY